MKENSIIISGEIRYTANAQILNSNVFKELIIDLIVESELKKNKLNDFFDMFIIDENKKEVSAKHDIDSIVQLCLTLTANTIEQIDNSPYFAFPNLKSKKELLLKFIEKLFNLWRKKHRFMVKQSDYTPNINNRIYKQMVLVEANEDLRNLVMKLYREILVNISETRLKILRQSRAGAQVGLMVDYFKMNNLIELEGGKKILDLKFIWNMVFEPPVIFYTRSNKRQGIFKVIDKPILDKVKLKNKEDWFVVPIYVCTQNILVIVHKEYLSEAVGLGNLFEIMNFDNIKTAKIDGIYFCGIEKEWFEKNNSGVEGLPDWNGVIYREKNGPYVSLVGRDNSTDYFGYMKKVILTMHNLNVIDEGRLPIHGAMAEIKLLNGKKANVLMMGDSGAGKSETLDALLRLEDEISEVNIIIDDMGSLDIDDEKKEIVSFGTETGAFVRLDDLQAGYVYSAMDRSIFMNPTEINSRLIVPYSNYEEIIKPIKIDFFLYVNNYEKSNNENDVIHFFKDIDSAIDVFSTGARMAKGTTAEIGLTKSYFSNPFGAIQRKEQHEKIVNLFMSKMMEYGVKIGEIKSQLGIPGFEFKGPEIGARSLLSLINSME